MESPLADGRRRCRFQLRTPLSSLTRTITSPVEQSPFHPQSLERGTQPHPRVGLIRQVESAMEQVFVPMSVDLASGMLGVTPAENLDDIEFVMSKFRAAVGVLNP